jgi:hypothetical protein
MTTSIVRAAALSVVVLLAATGCGGAAPNTSDPGGTVTAALDAAKTGGLAKVVDFTCAAKKGNIGSLFGAGGLGALGGGADVTGMMDAIKVDFQNVKTTETSKSGDTATVHVTGNAVLTFDAAKMKEAFKKLMSAQGLPADDATIDAAITGMSASLSQPQAMDEDVTLKQEGGKWLIC